MYFHSVIVFLISASLIKADEVKNAVEFQPANVPSTQVSLVRNQWKGLDFLYWKRSRNCYNLTVFKQIYHSSEIDYQFY